MRRKILMAITLLGMVFSTAAEGIARTGGDAYTIRTAQISASEIVLDFLVREYDQTIINLEGIAYTSLTIAESGKLVDVAGRELPALTAVIAAPPKGDYAIDVQVFDTVIVQTGLPLLPALQPVALDEPLTPGNLRRNAAALVQTEGLQPAQAVQVEEAWMRDHRLLTIKVFPFRFNGSNFEITFSPRLRVTVRFENGDEVIGASLSSSVQDDTFASILRNQVVNPEMLDVWRAPSSAQAVSATSPEAVSASPRYRIAIEEDGLYRMTYAQLQAAGLPVASIDPQTFQLDSQGRQVALYVSNSDGNPAVFSSGEYLTFYGQKFTGERLAQKYAAENQHWFSYWRQSPDGSQVLWKPEMSAEMFEKYTQTNVYWLTYNQSAPLRMPILDGTPQSAPVPNRHTAVARAEKDLYWRTLHFAVEDTFFWADSSSVSPILNYDIQLSALASGAYTATVTGQVVALTKNDFDGPDHHTQFFINDAAYAGAPFLDLFWEGRSALTFQGVILQSQLLEGLNQLNMKIVPTTAVPGEKLLFNWYEIHYQRQFQAQNNALAFTMEQPGPWKFQIGGYSSPELAVLDISTVYTPTWITGSQYAAGTLSFQASQPAGASYYAGKFVDLTAAAIVNTPALDLSAPADYIIVTHQDFLSAAQPLANYRASKGLDVRVIEQQELYDAFTYGIYHPLAVKELLRYAFANWSKPPTYVLLLGDGHWNFQGSTVYNNPTVYMPPHLAWVDPWQGEVDSSSLLANVVGDDILPDVMIARLPVNSSAEIAEYTNKVINYESQGIQPWQRNLLFIADNIPDPTGDFVYFSNAIAADYQRPGFTINKIYENDYGCPTVRGTLCPAVNYAITSTLSTSGALLTSFIGHASLDRWTHEYILLNKDRTFNFTNPAESYTLKSSVSTLQNPDRLPVVLSMTCLDGYWLHPGVAGSTSESIIEDLMRASGKGSIGAFSPTGLGVATGHDELERGFLDSLFNAGDWRLGAAAQSAKLRLFTSGSNYDLLNTFTIFGDPALQLRSPYAVGVTPPSAELAAPVGGSVTFGLQVVNNGAVSDTFSVSLGPSSWPADAPLEVGPLAPGASTTLSVMVQIPAGALYGSSDSVEVSLISQGDRSRKSTAALTTLASNYYASWQPPAAQKTGMPGSQVIYEIELVNSGFLPDSYNLALSGNSWPASILSGTTLVDVIPNERRTVRVAVTLPGTISGVDQDNVVITAQSHGEPLLEAQATLVTTAAYQIFLPVAMR